jgi:hypothetical protein
LQKGRDNVHLEIEGQLRSLIPLKQFRVQFDLPEEFGCRYFETKDWLVGSLDSGGQALLGVKENLLSVIPNNLGQPELLLQPEHLAAIFRQNLERVNLEIGLAEAQLDFAVDGLQNILSATVYDLARHYQLQGGNPSQVQASFDFSGLYHDWLNQLVTLFSRTYFYQSADKNFEIKLISYLYGRIGMRVELEGVVYYVQDSTLACPAASYMGDLCENIAQLLCVALTRASTL